MTSLFLSPVLFLAKKLFFRLFLAVTPALIMCLSANAQSVVSDRQTMTADVYQQHSGRQEAIIVNQTSGLTGNLPDVLPDAPVSPIQASGAGAQQSPTQVMGNNADTAQVTGIVSDAQGNGVSGAEITLTSPGKLGHARKTVASSDGSFAFTGLPAGRYRFVVTAAGLSTYTSSELLVKSGETVKAPKMALNLSAASSVNVYASEDQIAEAQVEEQQKQRVFGVFQNFYTSYIWDAEPMSAKQKYKLTFHTIVDPTTFVVLAGVAGAEHYNGTYPGYGPGIGGYGKRYGAALADSVSGRIIGSAILPSLFHQDPRYFYQGSGGIRSRTWHALSSALITRGDSGKLQPNYSHLLGNLAAGGIANAYHPASSRGLGLTFQTLGITTGANAIANLFREFVLRGLEPSVPGFANGKKGSPSEPSHR